jgi:hypothetical protein
MQDAESGRQAAIVVVVIGPAVVVVGVAVVVVGAVVVVVGAAVVVVGPAVVVVGDITGSQTPFVQLLEQQVPLLSPSPWQQTPARARLLPG